MSTTCAAWSSMSLSSSAMSIPWLKCWMPSQVACTALACQCWFSHSSCSLKLWLSFKKTNWWPNLLLSGFFQQKKAATSWPFLFWIGWPNALKWWFYFAKRCVVWPNRCKWCSKTNFLITARALANTSGISLTCSLIFTSRSIKRWLRKAGWFSTG